MTKTISAGYQLRVNPITGAVRALRGDHLIADTRAAKVMYETRLRPTIYFPASDVFGLGTTTDKRTFCPFKGTAIYHDLQVGNEAIANAAWSYPNPLREAREVEGYVGFMPGTLDHIETETDLPIAQPDGSISSPLVDWLMRGAWQAAGPEELTRGLAHACLAAGIAVSRIQIMIWSLHPLIAGVGYTWTKSDDAVNVYEARHEVLSQPSMYNSPIRHVSEGLGGVRQPLTTNNAEFSFPVMKDLQEQGATDYVAMPLTFSTGRINVLTMACDHPDGFTTSNLGLVFECSSVISRHFEVHAQQANAQTLLGTFLGKRTGERVLGGEVRRGDGEEIEAAVLVCDLRDSSRLEGELERHAYLDLLNQFFEITSTAVEANGGEVLKFIGDAVLAVFPAEAGKMTACAASLSSAQAIQKMLGEIVNPQRDQLRAGIGISYGMVTYGNVGSRDRLDFTVIGEAANIAARLSDLSKTIGEKILTDSKPSTSGPELRAVGQHVLHNISAPVDVWCVGS